MQLASAESFLDGHSRLKALPINYRRTDKSKASGYETPNGRHIVLDREGVRLFLENRFDPSSVVLSPASRYEHYSPDKPRAGLDRASRRFAKGNHIICFHLVDETDLKAVIDVYLQSEGQGALVRDASGSLTDTSIVSAATSGDSQETTDYPSDFYEFDPCRNDERMRVLREQTTRSGQQTFRQALIERHGEAVCAISGCRTAQAVQAAHIMPYLGEEDNHFANGLLLRADLHILFDRYLLGIEPDTLMVRLAPAVMKDPSYAQFDGLKLTVGYDISQPALQERWNWYEQNWKELQG